MNPRTIIFVGVLFAGAIASWYLARSHRSGDEGTPPGGVAYQGYYLKQARILGTGESGTLLYEIDAELAEQQADNRIEFTDVRIRYSPQSSVPWVVNADQATIKNDDPKIALRGHVQIVNSGGEDDTEIRTQYLELDPERFIADTDSRVQIRIGQRSLTATGMLASLHDDRIELKSNVRGKIAP
ncbi:MAG: LPS export ABC transporter periplasmic protein LptC [Gammaproteobacteria bacterium]|nr:LPS export ABC transporter periplasmic protein LptC [Gammaproteobacteria bacterium]